MLRWGSAPTEKRKFGVIRFVHRSRMPETVHKIAYRKVCSASFISHPSHNNRATSVRRNMSMHSAYSDKTTRVTRTSRGIGRVFALLPSADGFKVVVDYAVNTASSHDVVDSIRQSGGGSRQWRLRLIVACAPRHTPHRDRRRSSLRHGEKKKPC